jgi:PBP1b-binding outer membrane lipoprotein LpoB
MNTRKFIVTNIILLAVILSGCQGNALKASYFQSRPENEIGDTSTDVQEKSETDCAALNPHPMAESISGKFEITYDEVMVLYCDGYAFSDILLALETTTLVDQNVADLLIQLETKNWEEIWDDLGVNP